MSVGSVRPVLRLAAKRHRLRASNADARIDVQHSTDQPEYLDRGGHDATAARREPR